MCSSRQPMLPIRLRRAFYVNNMFLEGNHLSLYSTATQNTCRRGLALGNAPDARILNRRYQHVGIFWRYLMLKFAFSLTPTPDASQWNIGCVGSQCKILALAMYISCFLCRFHLRLVPNANPISSGIWALLNVPRDFKKTPFMGERNRT